MLLPGSERPRTPVEDWSYRCCRRSLERVEFADIDRRGERERCCSPTQSDSPVVVRVDVGGLRDTNGAARRCSSDDVTIDRRASRTRTWSVHRRAVARRPHSFAKQPYPWMRRPRCFYLDRSDHEHRSSLGFVVVVGERWSALNSPTSAGASSASGRIELRLGAIAPLPQRPRRQRSRW